MGTLLDLASLVVVPSGYKEDVVYSVKPTDGSGDLDFTRSNDTATRVNSAGLIEKVRTNLSAYSEQFDNAWWGLSNVTITANNTTDPFGGTAADKVLCSAGTISPNIFSSNVACTSGVEYTASYYAKQGTSKYAKIRFSSTAFASSTNTPIFDLNTGTVVSGTGTITSVGNGWYRISATQVAEASASGVFTVDIPSSTGVWPNGTFAGTEFIYIFGYQFETGVMTDYIPTTSAAVSVGMTANVPRLDYSGGGCPKLLLEPQRTNLALYSEQFDNAYWTNLNTTITANAAVSPDGYANADQITDDATSGSHYAYRILSPRSTGTAWSVFMKKGTLDYGFIGCIGDSVNRTTAVIDLTNGTVKELQNGSSTTGSVSVQDYGNGWYRVIMQTNANGGGTSIGCSDGSALSGGNKEAIYSGTGKHIFVWGAQLEDATYPTSYIPTLGAAVTRGADACFKTGISSLIGQTEGTLFVEFKRTPKGENYQAVITLQGASTAQLIEMFFGTADVLLAAVYNSGAQFQASSGGLTEGTYKAALAYKENDFAFYLNGSQIATDNSGTIPTLSTINLGGFAYVSGYPQADGIKQALVFPTRLTNTQLAELTTL